MATAHREQGREDGSAPAPVRRWRSESVRVRWALVAVLIASTVLPLWNLGRSGDFDFYGAAVRSMSESWRAFAFGAFDPAASVTLDKLSGFLLPQALSVRLFGFSWAAIALPQLIEGVVTVFSCATVALRLSGARAGLFAAAAAASTPIFVSMFGHSMEDGLLTCALAVALLWWQRAVTTGSVWPLVVSGLAVGVGFQAKMLQAWFVLPALVLALPVAVGWRRALLRAAVLVGVAVVASIAWMSVMQLQPGRPWFDGSVHDSMFSTVFAYNGVDRLLPVPPPLHGVQPPLAIDQSRLQHSLLLTDPAPAQTSPVKLLLPYYTTQIGWLYPLALAGVVLGLARWWRRDARHGQPRPERATLAAVTLWLAISAVVLSKASLAHTAYVAALGVQIAVLAAVALEEALRLRLLRRSGAAGRLVLPALLVVEVIWSAVVAGTGAMPLPLAVLGGVVVAGSAAVPLVAVIARRPVARKVLPVLVAAGLLAGATCWSLQAVDPERSGSPADAYIGPKTLLAGQGPVPGWRPRRPQILGGEPQLDAPLVAAIARITGRHRGAPPLFAVDSERIAAPTIEATGLEGLTDGGYSGGMPDLTLEDLRDLRARGRLDWVLTFLTPPRPDAVDRFVRDGSCHVLERWPPDRGSRVLEHGLALWHCG